ncbi:MAG: F0F1 ATP synthase subunit A [Clostridiales bacterium]|jgi:F-type H+-transporting ATPase subunit a|nr:F0F1 ATP synthase subunit A [Clostridiales bacterium]
MEQAIETESYVYLTVNGQKIPFITDTVVCMWVVMAIIAVLALVVARTLKTLPDRKQSVAEIIVSFARSFANAQVGSHGGAYAAYLGTVLIFLAVANTVAIFNVIPSGETLGAIFGNPALREFSFALHPPTKNLNVTLCLALVSIAVVICAEFRFKGVKGWVESFYKPTPISAFIKLLDYVVRPLSLCLRLFGNMLGGLIVMQLLYQAMPVGAPAVFGIYFDLFDGGLQAYVFVFLTALYIGEAAEAVESAEPAEPVEAAGG